MTLHEPSTLVTDLLLAALATWLGVTLRRTRSPLPPAAHWWSVALFATAVSAVIGGLFHGFRGNFPPDVTRAWWTATLLSVCAIAAAMDLALVHELGDAATRPANVPPPPRRRTRTPWLVAISFKFLAFATAAFTRPEFVIAMIAYGLTLGAWAVAAVALRRAWTAPMLLGLALSLVAAAVQQLRVGFGTHFNHNDLYHLIQAFALIAFQFAGRRFSPQRPPGECG